MADSSLVTKGFHQAHSGNYTANRASQGGSIKKITLHHFAGNLSLEWLAQTWQTAGRNGSSHYGVKDWDVIQCVREADVAWTDSNWQSNITSVTIEVSNSGGSPNWPVSAESLETTAKLCADIAKRNGFGTLVKGQNVTWHQMYAATACPGPTMLAAIDDIVNRANEINSGGGSTSGGSSSGGSSSGGSSSGGSSSTSTSIQVGDKVTVNAGAKFEGGVTPIASVYKTTYDVLQVSGTRVVIGIGSAVTGAMQANDLTKVGSSSSSSSSSSSTSFAVGNQVRVKNGAKDYNGTQLASFVYSNVYYIQELRGDRAVIGPAVTGAVTAAVSTSNLTKV